MISKYYGFVGTEGERESEKDLLLSGRAQKKGPLGRPTTRFRFVSTSEIFNEIRRLHLFVTFFHLILADFWL